MLPSNSQVPSAEEHKSTPIELAISLCRIDLDDGFFKRCLENAQRNLELPQSSTARSSVSTSSSEITSVDSVSEDLSLESLLKGIVSLSLSPMDTSSATVLSSGSLPPSNGNLYSASSSGFDNRHDVQPIGYSPNIGFKRKRSESLEQALNPVAMVENVAGSVQEDASSSLFISSQSSENVQNPSIPTQSTSNPS